MKKTILIIGIIIFSLRLFSSCPPPSIQAICQITKMDGTIIQGYIKIGTYGCNGLFLNGFLSYSDSINFQQNYYTMDFKSIEFGERLVISKLRNQSNSSPNKGTLKYMNWKSNPSIYYPYSQKLIKENNQLIYKISSNLEKKYILTDSIRIYYNLNKYTFIPSETEFADYEDISLIDILKITLLEKDEILNLTDLIKKSIEADKIANGPDSSGDFQLPLWYHDIILNERLLKQVNEHIKDYTLKN